MSKALIERLRLMSADTYGNDAADALEKTEAARMAAISRLCEAEVACATACQERDALAAGQKQMGEDLIVIQRIHSEQKARLYGEIAELKAELKVLREQEPVAIYKGHRHNPSDTKEFWEMANGRLPANTPLYARPVPAEPVNARLLERISNAMQSYERHGAICMFEGSPMIYASTLTEIADIASEAQQVEKDDNLVGLRGCIGWDV